MSTRVLVIDNHDSFVHTLVGYLRELGAEVDIVASDTLDASPDLSGFDAVMLSPGPGTPNDGCVAVVHEASRARIPLLGVCLGHQAIGLAFGTPVTQAPELMHGMTSSVTHDGEGLFAGIPNPFTVGRYHSLALAESALPAELKVTARAEGGTVMGIAHESLPIWGVQFHPESVLTESGYLLLANWLQLCGHMGAMALAEGRSPLSPN
jgi:para-aminobenzoate synthetase component 2